MDSSNEKPRKKLRTQASLLDSSSDSENEAAHQQIPHNVPINSPRKLISIQGQIAEGAQHKIEKALKKHLNRLQMNLTTLKNENNTLQAQNLRLIDQEKNISIGLAARRHDLSEVQTKRDSIKQKSHSLLSDVRILEEQRAQTELHQAAEFELMTAKMLEENLKHKESLEGQLLTEQRSLQTKYQEAHEKKVEVMLKALEPILAVNWHSTHRVFLEMETKLRLFLHIKLELESHDEPRGCFSLPQVMILNEKFSQLHNLAQDDLSNQPEMLDFLKRMETTLQQKKQAALDNLVIREIQFHSKNGTQSYYAQVSRIFAQNESEHKMYQQSIEKKMEEFALGKTNVLVVYLGPYLKTADETQPPEGHDLFYQLQCIIQTLDKHGYFNPDNQDGADIDVKVYEVKGEIATNLLSKKATSSTNKTVTRFGQHVPFKVGPNPEWMRIAKPSLETILQLFAQSLKERSTTEGLSDNAQVTHNSHVIIQISKPGSNHCNLTLIDFSWMECAEYKTNIPQTPARSKRKASPKVVLKSRSAADQLKEVLVNRILKLQPKSKQGNSADEFKIGQAQRLTYNLELCKQGAQGDLHINLMAKIHQNDDLQKKILPLINYINIIAKKGFVQQSFPFSSDDLTTL